MDTFRFYLFSFTAFLIICFFLPKLLLKNDPSLQKGEGKKEDTAKRTPAKVKVMTSDGNHNMNENKNNKSKLEIPDKIHDKTREKFSFIKDSLTLYKRQEVLPERNAIKSIRILKTKGRFKNIRLVEQYQIQDNNYHYQYSTAMVANQFLITPKDIYTIDDLEDVFYDVGVRVKRRSKYSSYYYVEFDVDGPDKYERVRHALKAESDMMDIQPNYIIKAI